MRPRSSRLCRPARTWTWKAGRHPAHRRSRPPKASATSPSMPSGLITDEIFDNLPLPYQVDAYGGPAKQVAITFDDGPDPQWTPKILDVLKAENAKATFFLIGAAGGEVSRRSPSASTAKATRSAITPSPIRTSATSPSSYMRGRAEPDRAPVCRQLGSSRCCSVRPTRSTRSRTPPTRCGRWNCRRTWATSPSATRSIPTTGSDNPRRTAEQITADVLANLPPCRPQPAAAAASFCCTMAAATAAQTVKALPMIIDGLRARGYQIVPVSRAAGQDTMPMSCRPSPPTSAGRHASTASASGSSACLSAFIVFVFFVGDMLMSGRLFLVGALAIFDRLRRDRNGGQQRSRVTSPRSPC